MLLPPYRVPMLFSGMPTSAMVLEAPRRLLLLRAANVAMQVMICH